VFSISFSPGFPIHQSAVGLGFLLKLSLHFAVFVPFFACLSFTSVRALEVSRDWIFPPQVLISSFLFWCHQLGLLCRSQSMIVPSRGSFTAARGFAYFAGRSPTGLFQL
jgi:hypothetical protein